MNKKVQNYLNENENTKLASIKEFIANHKADLKRAVALGLSTTTVIGMLAGCNSVQNQNSNVTLTDESGNVITKVPGETMFPPIQTTRPTEEVIETGVTAEDVLAELNNLCYHYLHKEYKDLEKKLGKDYKNISCDFISFGPDYALKGGEIDYSTYERYPYLKYYKMDLFKDEEGNHQTIRDFYKLSINFNYDIIKEQGEYRSRYILIPAFVIDKLMQTYNIEQIEATEEYLMAMDFYECPVLGDLLYDNPCIFNQQQIREANQEQLNCLYEVILAIKYYENNKSLYPENNEFELNQ